MEETPIVRVHLLGPLEVLRRSPDSTWTTIEKKQWRSSKPARSVFKLLCATPGRRLSRGQLQEHIWPDSPFKLADNYLYTAISVIHAIIGKELVTTWEAAYGLADQSLIWTDIDAALALLKNAENQSWTSLAALPPLEEALTYLEPIRLTLACDRIEAGKQDGLETRSV